jgi:hypothetical protein
VTTSHRDYFRGRQVGREEREARDQEERFEHELTGFVLSALHLPTNVRRALTSLAVERSGEPRMTLADFNATFPTFPILLGCSRLKGARLHVDKNSTIPSMSRHFDRTPIFACYEEFYERVAVQAGGKAIGLVFNRKGIDRGLIIHDSGLDDYWVPGWWNVYQFGTRQEPRRLLIQPFASLMAALYDNGRGWCPDS